jgi:hypothetical protein
MNIRTPAKKKKKAHCWSADVYFALTTVTGQDAFDKT